MIGEEQESETSQKETGEEGKIVACNLRSEVTKGLFTLWNKWKFSFGNTDEHNLGGSLFILDNKKKTSFTGTDVKNTEIYTNKYISQVTLCWL